jgi:hypothetical protein
MKNIFLHFLVVIFCSRALAQPTGNEKLVLDVYDIVNSDTLFISRKKPYIPMHEETVKVKFEGKKLNMLKTSFTQKEVHYKNYRLVDKSASHNPGFRKMSYDSLLSTEITGDYKSLQIIRDKKDTMHLELLGLSGHKYLKVPFKTGDFKIVIDEKAVNKKCHELLPTVRVNNMYCQNISPYYLERHIIQKDTPEHVYNVLWQYMSLNLNDNNSTKTGKSIVRQTKRFHVGSFVIDCKLLEKTHEYLSANDMSLKNVSNTIRYHTIDIQITDSVRNKLLFDTILPLLELTHFDFGSSISYAYTREKGFNRFNLVLTTSFYEPKKYFTYILEKDQFVYDLNTNTQMNKGRVVDGNFIFEVTRKIVPIDNGPYVPRIEEYWNYKVVNILSNKIVMNVDVPFHSNQLKGEDSIQQIDVNFDNFPDLHISSQIPQWNCYFVYNLEKDTFVYEPYINSLENLKIDWHDGVITGEQNVFIPNVDNQGVKRPPVEFIKEVYRFEGVGLKEVTHVTKKCKKNGECVVEKTEKLIYSNQRLSLE